MVNKLVAILFGISLVLYVVLAPFALSLGVITHAYAAKEYFEQMIEQEKENILIYVEMIKTYWKGE